MPDLHNDTSGNIECAARRAFRCQRAWRTVGWPQAFAVAMRLGGRVVVSGQVADYNTPTEERPGLRKQAISSLRA